MNFEMRGHKQRSGELNGDVYICLLSAKSNSAGVNTKDEIGFSWKETENRINASMDMFISEELRNWGIGTFIWNEIYSYYPETLRDNIFVSGLLRPEDPPELRDSFLRKHVCFDSDLQSRFLLTDSGSGYFIGQLRSKNLKHFPKINVSII